MEKSARSRLGSRARTSRHRHASIEQEIVRPIGAPQQYAPGRRDFRVQSNKRSISRLRVSSFSKWSRFVCDDDPTCSRDFFQRSVQCNSQMWTCEYSGRTNLTYDECLASEREALDLFDSFPDALKRPVLALVHRVRRAGLHHVVEDVVAFYRDRFVVGETISVSYAGRK